MRPSETKQTGGSDRTCAILPNLGALQQKRVDLKGGRLFRNKARGVAKSQSHELRQRAKQARGGSTALGLDKIHAMFFKHKVLWPRIFFCGCPSAEIIVLLSLTSSRL